MVLIPITKHGVVKVFFCLPFNFKTFFTPPYLPHLAANIVYFFQMFLNLKPTVGHHQFCQNLLLWLVHGNTLEWRRHCKVKLCAKRTGEQYCCRKSGEQCCCYCRGSETTLLHNGTLLWEELSYKRSKVKMREKCCWNNGSTSFTSFFLFLHSYISFFFGFIQSCRRRRGWQIVVCCHFIFFLPCLRKWRRWTSTLLSSSFYFAL
jgi:hypothetical protein